MREDENKSELFQMMAKSIASSNKLQEGTSIISTKLSQIKSNISMNASVLSPCNHKEGDKDIFACSSLRGFKEVKIITVDTDVFLS